MATYSSLLDRPAELERIAVSVLGTGQFGTALAARLAEAGAEVELIVRKSVSPLVVNKETGEGWLWLGQGFLACLWLTN